VELLAGSKMFEQCFGLVPEHQEVDLDV